MPHRPELIIHLNLPIIQIFYSQICSLLFKNNRPGRTAFSNSSSRPWKASSFVRGMAACKRVLSLYTLTHWQSFTDRVVLSIIDPQTVNVSLVFSFTCPDLLLACPVLLAGDMIGDNVLSRT